jgi:hypothetical protein
MRSQQLDQRRGAWVNPELGYVIAHLSDVSREDGSGGLDLGNSTLEHHARSLARQAQDLGGHDQATAPVSVWRQFNPSHTINAPTMVSRNVIPGIPMGTPADPGGGRSAVVPHPLTQLVVQPFASMANPS